MISQITSIASLPLGDAGQSAPAINIKPQKSAAPVELPSQPVKDNVQEVNVAAVREASAKINSFLQQNNSTIQFSVDAETSKRIVKVIDSATNELIRQVPSQETLDIAKALDKLQGLLLKSKA
jgi:flagellar protein FlaG